MNLYTEVPTAPSPPGGAHCETVASRDAVMFPKGVCLSDLTDAPNIPKTYDKEKNGVIIAPGSDTFTLFANAFADDMPFPGVLFQGEVFVMLPTDAQYDEKFMEQIDGDLLFYRSPMHRYPDKEVAQELFEQTAAWWRSVRQGNREEALMILKALYRLQEMGYPGPGFSMSNADVRVTFRSKTDPTDFAAIMETWSSSKHFICMIVNASPSPQGKWAANSREYSMAYIGRETLRYCVMCPRAVSVHPRK